MSSQNPIIYYENEENHGDYVYESLENIVNNFMQNQTGDNTIIGTFPRSRILYWAKKGLQQLNFEVLKEVKAVELELGDTLDIILPPDYVNYVRVSWVHPETGALMPMSKNDKLPLAISYLQDNNAEILFDNDGEILQGTTMFQELNDHPQNPNINSINVLNCGVSCSGCMYENAGCLNESFYRINTSKNANGYFNVDTRVGKMHFTSQNATKVIMLEYISDGLEYSSEDDIKVNKMAEPLLYAWINWNILGNKIGVQEYIVQRARKEYFTLLRNTKIKIMSLRLHELAHTINNVNRWFK
jgi:hypothetical protein